MQELFYLVVQFCLLFEEFEVIFLLVLFDIVMEVLLNFVVFSVFVFIVQFSLLLLEVFFLVNYESMKFEFENFLLYEEIMNVLLKKVLGIKEEIKEFESINVVV